MDIWADKNFRLSCLIFFTLYVCVGAFGVLWISDEFDSLRMSFYQHVGFPLALGFYCFIFLSPRILLEKRVLIFSLMTIISISFLWGHFLIFDFLNGNGTLNPLGRGVMSYHQGMSGQLYQTRF